MATQQLTGLELLEKRIRRTSMNNWLAATAMGGMTLVCGGLLATQKLPAWRLAILAGFTLAAGYVTWGLARSAIELWNARQSRVYLAVTAVPESIAWTYVRRMVTRAGPSWSLQLHFNDQSSFSLDGSEEQTGTLLALIQTESPQGIFGFGEAQRAEYLKRVHFQSSSLVSRPE